jgi:hypothetical protein
MVWSSAVSSTTTPNSNPGMDAPPAAPSARRRREHWLGQVRPPPGTQLCTQRSARRAGGGRRRFSAGELGCTGQPQQTRSKKIWLLFRIPWPCHPLSLSSALAAAIGVPAPLRGDCIRGSSSASGISSSMSTTAACPHVFMTRCFEWPYACVCVRACASVREGARVCVCVRAREIVCVCANV